MGNKSDLAKQLDREHRGRTSDNIQSLGNLIFVGLVIPQFIPGVDQFRVGFAFLGVVGLGFAYYVADQIARGGDNE